MQAQESSVSAAHEVAFGLALKRAAELVDTLGSSHAIHHCLTLVGDLNRSSPVRYPVPLGAIALLPMPAPLRALAVSSPAWEVEQSSTQQNSREQP